MFFHIGPQKCATTWFYKNFKKHPKISTSATDNISFFDMHFHRGFDWYKNQFQPNEDADIFYDPTPTYFRSEFAAKRIAKAFPDAKIICTLRNPTERAFSHYWHAKKKRRINYSFAECLEIYDLYETWISPGFYYSHLEKFFQYLPADQILVTLFDDIQTNPTKVFSEALAFVDAPDFSPNNLEASVNSARPADTEVSAAADRYSKYLSGKTYIPRAIRSPICRALNFSSRHTRSRKKESIDDINIDVLQELKRLFQPEQEALETLLHRDLPW